MKIDELLAKLTKVKGTGSNQWMACCPAHSDNNPSLSIRLGDDGKILLNCFADCSFEDICTALGVKVSELFAEEANPIPKLNEVGSYSYTDKDGKELYQIVRFEPKTFRPRRRVNGRYVWNLKDIPRVLYNLPDVIQSPRVWLVEGEKDADVLRSVNYVATTAVGGAGKWLDEYTHTLAGKDVVIVSDRDGADNGYTGQKHAQSVAQSLVLAGCTVWLTYVPDADCKDVADYFRKHGCSQDTAIVFEKYVAENVKPAKSIADLPQLITASDADRKYLTLSDLEVYRPDESRNIAGDGWLRPCAGCLFTGGTGIGKSVLAMQIAISVASGVDILGVIQVHRACRVVLIQAENDIETLQRDVLSIVEHTGADRKLVQDNLRIYHLYGLSGKAFADTVEGIVAEYPPEFLVIDPYQAYLGNQEMNSSTSFLGFIEPLDRIIKEHEVALMLVAHTPKPRERDNWTARDQVYMSAGSSTISNWARTSCELVSAGQELDRFKLTFGKNAERTGMHHEHTGAVIRHIFIEHSGCVATPFWRVSDNQAEPSKGKFDAAIAEYLAENIGAGDEDVAKAVGCARQTVWRWRKGSK